MPIYRVLGTIRYPASVRLAASTASRARIKVLYGEYDVLEAVGRGYFDLDPETEPLLVDVAERVHHYRVIFRETTQYAVEFKSNLDMEALLREDTWRDELDKFASGERIHWQNESAIGVDDTTLEHLEELPMAKDPDDPPPDKAKWKIEVIATGRCTCGHERRYHIPRCIKCRCGGFTERKGAK